MVLCLILFSGTLGIICEINVDDCLPGACHNNGTCVDKVGGFECRCPPGFVGSRCEGDINECLSNPCSSHGTLDCVQLVNNYHCNCRPGYMGRHCEVKVNFCESGPCQNGGVCSALDGGHTCICPDNYSGRNCEYFGYDCDSNPCQNGGFCRSKEGGGYRCDCPPGATGTHCELDSRNECYSNPCQHAGTCEDRIADYACYCLPMWNGKNCDLYDPLFRGGLGRDSKKQITSLSGFDFELEKEMEKCKQNNCRAKAGNHRCDEECNTIACHFDGNDCSLGINPWINCTANINCWEVFMNGRCDEVCNNPQCLFDGRDCEKNLQPCNPIYDAYCQKHYANGHCDYTCNNAECNWDGLDCEREPPSLADGAISIIVLMDMQMFKQNKVSFLRELGHELRATVRIKQEPTGHEMIYPWRIQNPSDSATNPSSGVIAYLELDNRRCTLLDAECFSNANEAADFLAASAAAHALSTTFPIYRVRGVSSAEYPPIDSPANVKYVLMGVFLMMLVGLLLGVLVTTQRKRSHGITWFPEGFLRNNSGPRRQSRRRGPDGQEMRHIANGKQDNISCLQVNLERWSDDESEFPPAKRTRDNGYGSDPIQEYVDAQDLWSQNHLDRKPQIMTPPSLENVDVRGPCGMTPLMIAAVRGGGLDTGDDEEEDGTAAVINDLVSQGAELNAAMDKTGETSLHLAARYARADAAKRLLDAGAEANEQDNTGRTPLHAAVAADAMGVFQILLRNRATNLNARMHDGTTPLILAARLAIEGMVEDLINADADINVPDNSGKTALHWAAAVNNIDAVNILLSHGVNRDAQDDKDETPLFLAAREGSYGACKALLDNFANREITDHMDRLPRDVASERLHHDIVRLLDEHIPRSPQMVSVISNGSMIGSPNHHHMISYPTVIGGCKTIPNNKYKRRPKSTVGNGSPVSPESEPPQPVRRKISVKKTNKKPPALDSLESGMLGGLDGLYGNAHSMSQPPAYDDCMKNPPMQNLGLDYQYQTSFQEPSPPHSVTLSPSPAKSRPSLPTSPTHIAAMRVATHQKHSQMQFDFTQTGKAVNYQQTQQQYYHYLTPPSETPESFPTPSPDQVEGGLGSPFHWSSSSPHSNSDWSEGISSPNGQQHSGSKQADAIYI